MLLTKNDKLIITYLDKIFFYLKKSLDKDSKVPIYWREKDGLVFQPIESAGGFPELDSALLKKQEGILNKFLSSTEKGSATTVAENNIYTIAKLHKELTSKIAFLPLIKNPLKFEDFGFFEIRDNLIINKDTLVSHPSKEAVDDACAILNLSKLRSENSKRAYIDFEDSLEFILSLIQQNIFVEFNRKFKPYFEKVDFHIPFFIDEFLKLDIESKAYSDSSSFQSFCHTSKSPIILNGEGMLAAGLALHQLFEDGELLGLKNRWSIREEKERSLTYEIFSLIKLKLVFFDLHADQILARIIEETKDGRNFFPDKGKLLKYIERNILESYSDKSFQVFSFMKLPKFITSEYQKCFKLLLLDKIHEFEQNLSEQLLTNRAKFQFVQDHKIQIAKQEKPIPKVKIPWPEKYMNDLSKDLSLLYDNKFKKELLSKEDVEDLINSNFKEGEDAPTRLYQFDPNNFIPKKTKKKVLRNFFAAIFYKYDDKFKTEGYSLSVNEISLLLVSNFFIYTDTKPYTVASKFYSYRSTSRSPKEILNILLTE